MSEKIYVKVRVDLPNHSAVGGESFWAEDIGNGLYKLENVPFFAYGLNFEDVVRAEPDIDQILQITEVVERSGNKTMRARFEPEVTDEMQSAIIEALRGSNCSLERWDDNSIAINIKPGGDIEAVHDTLESWANEGILDFETAHERVAGSFDDSPENESE